MNKRVLVTFILFFILSLGIASSPIQSETVPELTQEQEVYQRKIEIYQAYLKMQENQIQETNLFVAQPSSQYPYKAGQLKQTVLQSALATTNFVRSLAYLYSDVKLDQSWNTIAQHTSVVIAANHVLSHEPNQKRDMTDVFYQLGLDGARSSNIYFGYASLSETVLKYTDDSDTKNISKLGHRRWILNPAMTKVGFGYINTDGPSKVYSAMKIIGGNENSIAQYKDSFDYVAWPSKVAFPIEYFSGSEAWSVVLNTQIYDNSKLDQIRVILENTTTGLVQTFSKTQSDGYFNIDTNGCGAPYCIIFKPNVFENTEGSHYKVTISGIWDLQGHQKSLSYETEFFSLGQVQSALQENVQFADLLKQMSVLIGNNSNYELERSPTRLEGMVMLIRLLGKEEEALAMAQEPCIFPDVPEWGIGYVNYGYQVGLTKGIGNNKFGSYELLEANAYMTYMLRALSYSDVFGDFEWNRSLEKGLDLGILSKDIYGRLRAGFFIRGDMAAISYFTLKTKTKESEFTLLQSLVTQGAINEKFLLLT